MVQDLQTPVSVPGCATPFRSYTCCIYLEYLSHSEHVGDRVPGQYVTSKCGNDPLGFLIRQMLFSGEGETTVNIHITLIISGRINIYVEALQFGKFQRQIFASLIFFFSWQQGSKRQAS